MTKTVLLACVSLLVPFLTVDVATAGKKAPPPKDETLLGIVSCTVAAPKPPAPVPGPSGVPLPVDPTQPVPPATVAPPPPPGTVKDCLAQGGQVMFHPDASRTDLVIENPDLIKGHEWHRVSITGYPIGNLFRIVSLRGI
jgi:hypothetical protein